MLNKNKIYQLNWIKTNGLIPVIIQDYISGIILMHGYMNKEALNKTIDIKKVTLFSRSKKRLWTKGEKSGNFINVFNIIPDCDNDTLLILAKSTGPVCHTGSSECFLSLSPDYLFLFYLEKFINNIKNNLINKSDNSYISKLFFEGNKRIAQKVGEEGLEVALASMENNNKELINEVSDLIFHLLVLLQNKNIFLENIIINLCNRHKVNNNI